MHLYENFDRYNQRTMTSRKNNQNVLKDFVLLETAVLGSQSTKLLSVFTGRLHFKTFRDVTFR